MAGARTGQSGAVLNKSAGAPGPDSIFNQAGDLVPHVRASEKEQIHSLYHNA